jgi:chromosomal replication initiation ATPase DnaA
LTRGREILQAICAESGFTEEAIRSSAQTGTLPLARREFAHRCKAEKISTRAIADLLGRDHTTIYSFSGGLPGSDGNPALGRLPAILQEVCGKYGVTADALRSRKRSETLISARREFCQRCAAEDIGVTEIANALHRTLRPIYAALEN